MPGIAILLLPAPFANGVASPPVFQVSEQQPKEDKPATEEQNKAPVATHTRTTTEEQNKAPVATHTRTIGTIYPPLDIRSIVDKIVQFVVKNGSEFEKRILVNNANNVKINFLNPSDPYHAHYQHRLSEARSELDIIKLAGASTMLAHRSEWERSQEQARQKAEDEIEQERMQMAMIHWHDFVGVETIDFVDEELPPPMTFEEVIRRSKISTISEEEIIEPEKEVEMEMDEEEVQLVEEGRRAASLEELDG